MTCLGSVGRAEKQKLGRVGELQVHDGCSCQHGLRLPMPLSSPTRLPPPPTAGNARQTTCAAPRVDLEGPPAAGLAMLPTALLVLFRGPS